MRGRTGDVSKADKVRVISLDNRLRGRGLGDWHFFGGVGGVC